MHESYSAITLWPAASLPASVARELQRLGVNLATQEVNDGLVTVRATPEGTVVLDVSFDNYTYGLIDLEAALATLRIARISYLAWDELASIGYAFDPATEIERQFNTVADGKPVFTSGDLKQLEDRYHDAEALVDAIRAWLRPPIPDDLSDLPDGELTIAIVPDEEDEDDDRIEIVSEADGQALAGA
jgi:hypothetical protein